MSQLLSKELSIPIVDPARLSTPPILPASRSPSTRATTPLPLATSAPPGAIVGAMRGQPGRRATLRAFLGTGTWPRTATALVETQRRLADASRSVEAWLPPEGPTPDLFVGGCFLAFGQGLIGPGGIGDRGWAVAVLWRGPQGFTVPGDPRDPDRVLVGSGPHGPRQALDVVAQTVVVGTAAAAYEPGLLAQRDGAFLEAAVRLLPRPPDVLLVDATGRDHPRRAGLALHLGAVLGVPTVGVTRRPLLARGALPSAERGGTSPLYLNGEVVGRWARTRGGARPVVAHAGWRTSAETAASVVLATSSEGARTPAPLGEARRVAREARAIDEGRVRQP